MKRRWTSVLALSLSLAPVLGGEQEPVTPVFRVTSSRVVFEFIAVDKDGRVVSDLTKDDIEVTVDGTNQKVDYLSAPGEGFEAGYVTASQMSRPTPSTSGGNDAAADPGDIRPPQSPLQTTILLDTRVFDASNFSHSVDAIRRFIETSLQEDSWVMLAEIDRGLKVVTPLTRDREALLRGVDSVRPASVYNPLDRSQLSKSLGATYFDDLVRQISYLREGLTRLCEVMSAWPGRKHIVLFSEGYPLNPNRELEVLARQKTGLAGASTRQAASRVVASRKDPGVLSMVREVVSLANTHGIKFYAVDARGLEAVTGIGKADVAGDFAAGPGSTGGKRTPNASSETGLTEVQVANLQLTQVNDLDDAGDTLVALAAGTNGSAFLNSNDLGVVLRASTAEDTYTYVGSFTPELKGKPKFRQLRVKCKRKGVIVRSQAGFTDFTTEQILGFQLATAFDNPELFQGLKPLLEVEAIPGEAKVVMGLPGSEATARPQGELFHLSLAFAGRVFDGDGKSISKGLDIQRGFAPDVTREQFVGLAGQPLLARESLRLSRGKFRLVLVVVDQVSGGIGTAVREFSVP